MTDHTPRSEEERRAAKVLARKERRARRRREKLTEADRVGQVTQAARPQQQIAPAASSLGPLGRRVGRIASSMVIRQALNFLFRAVLRR